MIRTVMILLCASVLILGGFALSPGIGIAVALLSYGAVQGLLSR